MRAVVHDRYGPPDVLRIEDVQRPVPAEDELLVRVHATTVTQTDCHMRAARPFVWRFMLGLRRPRRRTLGLEFAGVVEDVGSAVTQFAVGGRVFGLCSSAHAEYVCVRESRLVAAIPAGMSFEEAAAVCDGMSQALGALRKGRVGPGTRLVVYGASGSLGTGAVQLAHYLGAHVTAVCNTPNVQLVRSLGADEVIDYTQEDFTESGGSTTSSSTPSASSRSPGHVGRSRPAGSTSRPTGHTTSRSRSSQSGSGRERSCSPPRDTSARAFSS